MVDVYSGPLLGCWCAYDADTGSTAILDFHRPWTHNSERQMHYLTRSHKVADVRARVANAVHQLLAPAVGRYERPVDISAVELRPNRRSMPDTGACAGAAKAMVDGAVDGGLLDDDAVDYVRRLIFYPPTVCKILAPALMIVAEPVPTMDGRLEQMQLFLGSLGEHDGGRATRR